MNDPYLLRMCRRVRKDKNGLGVFEMRHIFNHGMSDSTSLRCFLPRLLLLAAFHAGGENFPSFEDILERIQQYSFADWLPEERKEILDFLGCIRDEVPSGEGATIRQFMENLSDGAAQEK